MKRICPVHFMQKVGQCQNVLKTHFEGFSHRARHLIRAVTETNLLLFWGLSWFWWWSGWWEWCPSAALPGRCQWWREWWWTCPTGSICKTIIAFSFTLLWSSAEEEWRISIFFIPEFSSYICLFYLFLMYTGETSQWNAVFQRCPAITCKTRIIS